MRGCVEDEWCGELRCGCESYQGAGEQDHTRIHGRRVKRTVLEQIRSNAIVFTLMRYTTSSSVETTKVGKPELFWENPWVLKVRPLVRDTTSSRGERL